MYVILIVSPFQNAKLYVDGVYIIYGFVQDEFTETVYNEYHYCR